MTNTIQPAKPKKQQPPVRKSTMIIIKYTNGQEFAVNNVVDYGMSDDEQRYTFRYNVRNTNDGVIIDKEVSVSIPLTEIQTVTIKMPYGMTTILDVREHMRAVRALG